MGGDEDDQKELQRLQRDLAAIDARWSTEGYHQRTSSRVLDDERDTRHELQLQLMRLETRLKSSAATPALGTGSVRANTGVGWQPLPIYESTPPEPPPGGLPPAPFDVDPEQPKLEFEELSALVFDLVTRDWRSDWWSGPYNALGKLVPKWREVPGAPRLLSAAYWSFGALHASESLAPKPKFETKLTPLLLRSPMLTGAVDVPDAFSGLTPLDTRLLSALRNSAPDTGPFLPLAALLAEARLVEPEISETDYVRLLGKLGHPALRTFPLVAFQGFSGRFDPQPTFTHARITAVGSELLSERFPLPMLLVNGAEGVGHCALPYHPHDIAVLCLEMLQDPNGQRARAVCEFDVPSGAPFSKSDSGVWSLGENLVSIWPVAKTEFSVPMRKARVLLTGLPWPMSALDVIERIELARQDRCLDGVTAVLAESSADEQRVVVELEHAAFAAATVRFLTTSPAIAGQYSIRFRVRTPEITDTTPRGIVSLFLDAKKQAAALQSDKQIGIARQRVAEHEAICVALELLDRVRAVTRDALSDAEAATALLSFMRPEDRQALKRLPNRLSHGYESGFTLEQARHIVRQRKLASRPKEAAWTDWTRALAEATGAVGANDDAIREVVRRDLVAAKERFASFPRRARSR